MLYYVDYMLLHYHVNKQKYKLNFVEKQPKKLKCENKNRNDFSKFVL